MNAHLVYGFGPFLIAPDGSSVATWLAKIVELPLRTFVVGKDRTLLHYFVAFEIAAILDLDAGHRDTILGSHSELRAPLRVRAALHEAALKLGRDPDSANYHLIITDTL